MPQIPDKPELQNYQHFVQQLEIERGFDHQTVLEKCLMLGEEVGELFKAIRKRENIKIDPNSKTGDVAEELADVFLFLCSIANRYDIDLASAIKEKEGKNRLRKWV
jgi:NTP pyrophosphatase (non-canonical NTP hydrolase)